MSYATVAPAWFAARRAAGRTVPLNSAIAARAFAVLGLPLSNSGEDLRSGTIRADSVLNLRASLPPGVQPGYIQIEPGRSGDLDPARASSAWQRDFLASDVAGDLGPHNMAYLGALRRLWTNRIAKAGVFAPDEIATVLRLIDIGVPCVPQSEGRLRLASSDYRVREPLLSTPAQREQWAAIVAEVRAATSKYLRETVALAAAEVAKSEAALERWEAIYALVQVVALPGELVKDGAKGLFNFARFFAENRWLVWVLGIGAAAWFLLPRGRKAWAKVKAARDG